MEERVNVLIYAVRGRVILKYSGQLALMLGVLTLVPLGVALLAADWMIFIRYAVICGGLFLVGGLLARLPAPTRIQANEALTVTVMAFVCSSLLMSWPLMADGLSFIDALFESVSGVTTTGLTTLNHIENQSMTFLFSRAWMQWYGGLGIVVLSVALLIGHHAAARRLAEPVDSGETLLVTARTHARLSLISYLCLTLFGFVLVWSLSGNGFPALLHVLSAVSTGGFSPYNNSLAGMESQAAAIAVIFISFLGAVSLPLYWRVAHAGWREGLIALFTDVELRALLLTGLLVGLMLTWLGWFHGEGMAWYHGFMLGFSAQTTTGFVTTPISELDAASKVIMIFAMLVGGSVGSSAGGFKLLRLLILLRMLQLMLRRVAMPSHAVAEPYLSGHKLETDDMMRALQLILLFIGVAFLSWIPFVVMGYDPLDALFEVVSACGTVGLSSGISRSELEPILKGVLCFDMLAGRVEIIALLIVLYPRNWIGRREETA
ncbi:MAG: potassium transporter TrkG [Thiohalomonadales bacterium]|nr:potassium transporter TrkG [Thiohalomonadales bacterium]